MQALSCSCAVFLVAICGLLLRSQALVSAARSPNFETSDPNIESSEVSKEFLPVIAMLIGLLAAPLFLTIFLLMRTKPFFKTSVAFLFDRVEQIRAVAASRLSAWKTESARQSTFEMSAAVSSDASVAIEFTAKTAGESFPALPESHVVLDSQDQHARHVGTEAPRASLFLVDPDDLELADLEDGVSVTRPTELRDYFQRKIKSTAVSFLPDPGDLHLVDAESRISTTRSIVSDNSSQSRIRTQLRQHYADTIAAVQSPPFEVEPDYSPPQIAVPDLSPHFGRSVDSASRPWFSASFPESKFATVHDSRAPFEPSISAILTDRTVLTASIETVVRKLGPAFDIYVQRFKDCGLVGLEDVRGLNVESLSAELIQMKITRLKVHANRMARELINAAKKQPSNKE
jgi:hypothetical protein